MWCALWQACQLRRSFSQRFHGRLSPASHSHTLDMHDESLRCWHLQRERKYTTALQPVTWTLLRSAELIGTKQIIGQWYGGWHDKHIRRLGVHELNEGRNVRTKYRCTDTDFYRYSDKRQFTVNIGWYRYDYFIHPVARNRLPTGNVDGKSRVLPHQKEWPNRWRSLSIICHRYDICKNTQSNTIGTKYTSPNLRTAHA